MTPTPAFFHPEQLEFKPAYEWAFGARIEHPETTARAENILAALAKDAAFSVQEPARITPATLQQLHAQPLLTLYNTAGQIAPGEAFYPTVFPKKSQGTGDPTRLQHAGNFCFDAGTPLTAQTLNAATWSASCALSAAKALRGDTKLTYALSRPPGHHAERALFGGYCYFNNAGVAARHLRRRKLRVAILDVDFHHGNGTQSLFYKNDQVFVLSVHGDPSTCFPYFAGYPSETGEGVGNGYTMNMALERGTDGQTYIEQLTRHVLPALQAFGPDALVLSMGLDTYHLDPVGDFTLTTEDMNTVGRLVGGLGLPTVAVQEGGYYAEHLGQNATAMLRGLRETLCS